MPVHKSVLKRERENEARRLANRINKSIVHTAKIRLDEAIAAKDKEAAYKKLSVFMSTVDKNAKRGIFHKNKANRLKARATKKVKVAFNELAPVAE